MCLASSGSKALCWKDSTIGSWTTCALAAKVANPHLHVFLPTQTGPKEPPSCGKPGLAGDEAFAAGYWTDARGMARRAVEMVEGQEQWISSRSGAEISLWMSGWVDTTQKSPFVCGASEMGEWEGAAFERILPCSRAERGEHGWMQG